MSYYKSKGWNNLVRYFPMPNIIFQLGLSPQEIAIYAYLMCIEDRKTYQCHPSYSSIGKSCGIRISRIRCGCKRRENRPQNRRYKRDDVRAEERAVPNDIGRI